MPFSYCKGEKDEHGQSIEHDTWADAARCEYCKGEYTDPDDLVEKIIYLEEEIENLQDTIKKEIKRLENEIYYATRGRK